VVRLLAVEGAGARVLGLDAVDGTPVLDLKPYLAPYDSVPEALLPDWARSP
jgi:tRNA (Thr-GGU) A37 N-methylase